MATRLYLSTAPHPLSTITPHASWTWLTYLKQYKMNPVKLETALANEGHTETGASGDTYLIAQWISPPMAAGAVFVPSSTIFRSVARWSESSTSANAFVQSNFKVVSRDGTTNRFVAGFNTDANEFSTSLTSRVDSRSSASTDYTTVDGDRMVLEYGFVKNSTSSFTITVNLGDNAANDLDASDTDTDADNPYFELTNLDVTFLPEGTPQLMLTGCGR